MKDSGVEWIGEIPEGWDVRKLKYCGKLDSNGVDKKQRDGEKLFKSVHYMDVYTNSLHEIGNSEDYLVISADVQKAEMCTLKQGDVLLTTSSENPEDIGHSAEISEDLDNTLFGYHLMRFRATIPLALHLRKYLIGSYLMRQWFEYRSVGMTRYGLSRSDITDAQLILPPFSTQNSLASFLDTKSSLIDAAVQKEREIIGKLKEYRQAVITEGVTKGIRAGVPMKDSGVEWIGEIPEGWDVQKIKSYYSIVNGSTPKSDKSEYWGGDIIWITPAEMSSSIVEIYDSKRTITEEGLQSCGTTLLPINSIILSTRAPIGQVCIAGTNLCTNQGCKSLVMRKEFNYKYSYYYLSSQTVTLNILGRGTTFMELSTYDLANYPLPIPPLPEQQEIADYLDAKCSAIDATIQKRELAIEKLTAYKQSLIYECVTGKREVLG